MFDELRTEQQVIRALETVSLIPKLALSIREAGTALSLSERTVEGMVKRGDIPSFREGRRVLIPVDGLREWVRAKAECGYSHPTSLNQARGAVQ